MPHATTPTPHVLIIGAGLGGLALAQGLKKHNVPFTIFERDPSADFRPQGYRLKLNPDGFGALRSVLPTDLWTRFEATCCADEPGETDFNAITGSVMASRRGGGPAKSPKPMTCDRTVLRNILLTDLVGTESIQFGKELQWYDEDNETGTVTAHFTDGTSSAGSFLVGADGVRSRVRRALLPEHKPLDTGGFCVYGKTPLTPELASRFPRRALRWMTLCVDSTPITHSLDGDERPLTLLLEPIRFPEPRSEGVPGDYVYWVLISQTSLFASTEDEVQKLLRLSAQESAALSLDMTAEWDAGIRSLLELQDVEQSSTLRICSADPDMTPWSPNGRVALLGDAVHVMSPCGGVGAATALKDASELAASIHAQQGRVKKEEIGNYEEGLRARAKVSIERSYFGGRKMFQQRPFAKCSVVDV